MLRGFMKISEDVSSSEEILTVSMAQLRDAMEVKRLGEHVINDIRSNLTQLGLGYYPELSADQKKEIRLFRRGSIVGEIIAAVIQPSSNNDVFLREKLTGHTDATRNEQVLAEIRRLVCN